MNIVHRQLTYILSLEVGGIYNFDQLVVALISYFQGEKYTKRFNELKKEVGVIMNEIIDNPLKQLELIDTLQRLGISYHFENQIKDMLERIYNQSYMDDDWKKNDLYAVALEFRLLRQHRLKFHKVSIMCFSQFRKKKIIHHLYIRYNIISNYTNH